ncbi:MAG: ABC transporter permease subunit [Planctomycetota bacterium]|nr:ABC transporter permease subunit [Planctomycetota bacterium]
MPILSRVGSGSPAQVLARVLIYTLLTCGALCIVYPLLIVVGQAMSNEWDHRDNAVVPEYLYDRNDLALKHIFSLTRNLSLLASNHHQDGWTSQSAMRGDTAFYAQQAEEFARHGVPLDNWQAIVRDLNKFKTTIDVDNLLAIEFRIEDHFRPFLREKYGRAADAFVQTHVQEQKPLPEWFTQTFPEAASQKRVLGDRETLGIALMNHELRSDYLNYHAVEVPPPGNLTVPVWRPFPGAKSAMWREFTESLPPEQKLIVSSDAYWHDYLQKKYPTVKDLNAAWGKDHKGFYGLVLSFTPPPPGPVRKDWEEFIVKRWPRRLLELPKEYAGAWREFVRSRFLKKEDGSDPAAQAAALNAFQRSTGLALKSWDELRFPATRPADDVLSRYWCEFTFSGAVPPQEMILLAPELQFRVFLCERYWFRWSQTVAEGKVTALAALNAAWKTSFKSFEEVPLPLAYADCAPARFEAGALRWSFATEPFKRILEYVLGRGRAAQNTLILVTLSLLSALTINPLAAYSLSRFSMKQSHKVLVFFLATMAFPAEVAMIPNFLLLRDFGLLNSYAALILPGMANGFAIFLLKCFFDSLPRELYEAAEIDGASELQIFRLVALPLLTPILAFIGLTTFVAAYGGFMWAFVICPKEEMWTLMVWVYDFQTRNTSVNYIMAATLLVCIPPLIVFLFANRIIMRGIMIPTMK